MPAKKKTVVVDTTTNETMDINEAITTDDAEVTTDAVDAEEIIVATPEEIIEFTPEEIAVANTPILDPVAPTNPSPRRYTPPVVEKVNTPTIVYGRNGRNPEDNIKNP